MNKRPPNKMKKIKTEKTIVAITLLFILLAVNFAMFQKEQHIKHGDSVYLELAPVDPRSLMQGDYMALNYAIVQNIRDELENKSSKGNNDLSEYSKLNYLDAKAIVTIDSNGVGRLTYIDENCHPCGTLQPNEKAIAFRLRHHQIKIASNAFFFQEGSGRLYAMAKYAHIRLNKNHEPLLVGLLDEDFREIQPTNEADD